MRNIEAVAPDVIATGNIGCITQIASGTIVPVVHTVELLDWAYGDDQADFLRRRSGAGPRRPGAERRASRLSRGWPTPIVRDQDRMSGSVIVAASAALS